MDEQLIEQIAKRVKEILEPSNEVPIEASGRHVHLSREHVELLFGKDYKLKKKKELSQPGQYQCEERVILIGPKGVIQNVAVLGPERDKTQVEISKTDAISLGVDAPIRESGDLEGSGTLFIATENAVVKAEESVIIAKRHIHMTREDAKRLKVKDKDIVKVKVKSDRPIIFEDVVVRVSDRYKLSMHIDYDEANASNFRKGIKGEILL
jgi:putative phosphotransacetylase